MTFTDVSMLCDRIQYKDWILSLKSGMSSMYIQWHFKDGQDEWSSRKWYISEHMTPSEVIQTIFKAALTAEEHETREKFLFDGIAILGPHIDLIKLADNYNLIGSQERVHA